ncbi:putative multidrug ABC transporter permease YbhR [Zhongshania aliphaticivorans]|uniref:Putative multidrug ABC transporter permease YbhR n=1 Tax=Zhongshania aliphaticivorans TaxID=1470434 RepID=A0A5S9PRD0_9GAMM|nr:putative multidrug ABC transporter permease YbhR [Zhongshania aliphaticivorans]CAA0106607.1 putative multidrug ABC transporter permease YbhR [Zhongshania aliphaticivorans]
MLQLLAIIRKELLLLCRDLHGLLLLFVMPLVFILIMSLAMKDDFDRRSGVQLDVLVSDLEHSDITQNMLNKLAQNEQFNLIRLAELGGDIDAEQAIKSDHYSFLVTIPERAFTEQAEDRVVADVLVAPATSPVITQLLVAALIYAAAEQNMQLSLKALQEYSPELEGLSLVPDEEQNEGLVSTRYAYSAKKTAEAPTSVQQNVPAWLVFSMFFVVIPLANTLINERQLGTLRRIQTIPVASWKLIAGKIIPYFFINQIQVLLMLAVGVTIVPLLGGDRLTLGSSIAGLMLISAALSVAALGYAMLIAVLSRTTEQATTMGGAGNIILAAIGGIMVPAFVMPEFMQAFTVVSPMSWGLQGLLDIFLRGGGIAEVYPEAGALFLLGMILLGFALLLLSRHRKY